VVFEHVGADTFNGSLLTLKRGGRLVTCGSTSGPTTTINLMQLVPAAIPHLRFVRRDYAQHRREPRQDGRRHAPVIDTEVPIEDVAAALKRMESRRVFGKIVVYF